MAAQFLEVRDVIKDEWPTERGPIAEDGNREKDSDGGESS
jgi:hypothetical protein